MCKLCHLASELEYENNHSHTMYSNISTPDSTVSIEEKAIRCVELGQKTLSTVEHGYCGDIFTAHLVAKEYGLKLLFGIEYYFVKDRFQKDRTNSHLLVMALNEKGRAEMSLIMSESYETGIYGKPRIDEELLFSLSPENVVVTTACIGSPINQYEEEYAHEFIKKCKDYFGKNFYLEVQPHTNIKQVEFNQKLLEYREQYDIELILGVDSHYIEEEDAVKRDLLLKGKNINYPEEDGFIIDFPPVETILKRFEEQNVLNEEQVKEAFNNTLQFRDVESPQLNDDIKMISIYPDWTHEQKVAELKRIINEAWIEDRKHIPKERWPEYIEAMKFEIDIIEKTKMEDYFLMNQKVIKRAIEHEGGVLTNTGRGSGVSNYTNKLLGFTQVDRLQAPIELYPTRFMSLSRILETVSLPDIDFNTASDKPFLRATQHYLGEKNVFKMIAYGKMKDSEAFRNYCRAIGIDKAQANIIGKDIDNYRRDDYWGKIIEESKIFIGVVDSASPSPCAFLLLDENIQGAIGTIKLIPQNNKKAEPETVCLIDSKMSDKFKYLKNDYLTVTVVDIINQVYEEIGKPVDDIRTLVEKTKDNEKVWNLYRDGIVSTLNQTGSESGKPQVMQYAPTNERELSMWVSAIRPAFASMKSKFLNREEFHYGIPEFDKLLESSDNFILFQENIMTVLQYAGFPEDETYGLLKAISKKEKGIIEPIHDKFINGFVDKTGSEENALKVWQIMEDAVG